MARGPSDDRVAVVTGGTSGVGRAVVTELAARGMTVCVTGRNVETLEQVVAETRDLPGRVHPYRVDLSEDGDLTRFVRTVTHDQRRVDVLVHSAAVHARGSFATGSIETLDEHYAVNVRAVYALTQGMLRLLDETDGEVIFVNSTVGLAARSHTGAYAASKHALRALADSLRDEVNALGIRVLTVYLGNTATPMQESIHEEEGRLYRPELFIQPEDVARLVADAIELPRTAEVTEIRIQPFLRSA